MNKKKFSNEALASFFCRVFKLSFLFCNFSFTCAIAKVLIIVPAYNKPNFIKWQHETFKKFLEDDYELIIFSDAKTEDMHQQIKFVCDACSLTCVRVPQEIHDLPYLERLPGPYAPKHQASVRNANVVQYALDTIGFNHNDVVALIDSDLFLTKPFSIVRFLNGYDVAAFLRPCCDFGRSCKHSIKFMWPGIIFFDMKKLPNKETINFNCGYVNGVLVDAGGYTYYYMRNNPKVRVKNIKRLNHFNLICNECRKKEKKFCNHNKSKLLQLGFEGKTYNFMATIPLLHRRFWSRNTEFFIADTFIHFHGGTNHNNTQQSFHDEKLYAFEVFLEGLLSNVSS